MWLRVELFLYWLMAGFGYRPLRVIATALATILLYGVLYWTFGGVRSAVPKEKVGFWEAIYLSGITFATVGYGDFVPTPHLRMLALTEGILGIFTITFFVVVLANRLRH